MLGMTRPPHFAQEAAKELHIGIIFILDHNSIGSTMAGAYLYASLKLTV